MSQFALNLQTDGRILSATYPQFASADSVLVDSLPAGDLADYRYENGEYIYAPLSRETAEHPTQLDRIEAQLTYTAMMTDTLLEV